MRCTIPRIPTRHKLLLLDSPAHLDLLWAQVAPLLRHVHDRLPSRVHGPQQVAVAQAVTHEPADKRVHVGAHKLAAWRNKEAQGLRDVRHCRIAHRIVSSDASIRSDWQPTDRALCMKQRVKRSSSRARKIHVAEHAKFM